MRGRLRDVRLARSVGDAGQQLREMPAAVLAGIGVQEARDAVAHRFRERRRVDREHRRAAQARFDDVEAQRLAVRQSGQQVVDAAIGRRDVALVPPEADARPKRAHRAAQFAQCFKPTAMPKISTLTCRLRVDDRREDRRTARETAWHGRCATRCPASVPAASRRSCAPPERPERPLRGGQQSRRRACARPTRTAARARGAAALCMRLISPMPKSGSAWTLATPLSRSVAMTCRDTPNMMSAVP